MSETLDLFKTALGLGEPWRVTRSDFDVAQGRLDLYLDFPRGARFGCSVAGCDQGSCPVHDTEDKTWRHLDFFQYKAFLHARVPRTRCPEHGVHLVEVVWARPESGFTLLFEALLIEFATAMSVARVAAMHQFGPGPPAPSSRRCRRPRRSPNGSVSRRSAPPGGTAPAAMGHRPDRRAGSSRRPRGQAAGHGLDGPRACRPRRSSRRRDTGRRPDIPSPSSASRSHRSGVSVACDHADCWSSPFPDQFATGHTW